ncbi:hypothetical protein [uncultured Piscinibacter sp.]|uniref:hypothetical protein n=1 Tax=uncultured Piscinibacter sp. TaxID=1131835 RepID=UPI00260A8480|nr:hypothetical protein [uncultured Piscinibacter sp.]
MQRFAIAALGGLLGLLPTQSPAQTEWLCGLSEDAMRLVCVAEAGPRDSPKPALRPVAQVNGTKFPLDPRRLYTVELWGPATEMDFVEELARSTMCYRSPACAVTFIGPRIEVALSQRQP